MKGSLFSQGLHHNFLQNTNLKHYSTRSSTGYCGLNSSTYHLPSVLLRPRPSKAASSPSSSLLQGSADSPHPLEFSLYCRALPLPAPTFSLYCRVLPFPTPMFSTALQRGSDDSSGLCSTTRALDLLYLLFSALPPRVRSPPLWLLVLTETLLLLPFALINL